MPNKPTPTPSYLTQRARSGPKLQNPAKTANCNYLGKHFSFEDFFPYQGGKNQDRRFETTPCKPNADTVKDVGTE